jgi:outer membrane protein TolC
MKNKTNIMKNRLLAAIAVLLLPVAVIKAQESSGELKLTLKEAQDYALAYNKSIKSAKYDVQASRYGRWEAISAGLLQVSSSASVNDNLIIMTRIINMNGVPTAFKFGTTFDISYGLTASTAIFNAPYIVGIQTATLAQKLAGLNVERAEQDTRESVIMSYYLILVSEESLKILDGNISVLNETLRSTRSMLSAGMAEATDVDQMVSNVTMMENTKSSMQRTLEVNYNMLRFQLGISPETRVILTESLESIVEKVDIARLLNTGFDVKQNLNYKLFESQEQMSKLSLKMQKSTVLPALSGFYTYSQNGMGDKLNKISWFPNSIVGAQLSVPIFATGTRYSKIKQAQINLEKARTGKEMVTEQLLLQEKQLRFNLVNAREQYNLQKANIDVSKRVYTSTENKFKQGMASSLDLTQANSLYLQAENNYISSLMNLLQTKLALDKLLNNM